MRDRDLPSSLVVSTTVGSLLLGGCAADPGNTSREESTPAPGSAGTAQFPVTLQQASGAITVERAPERVYVVDMWGLDMTVGLGACYAYYRRMIPPLREILEDAMPLRA